MKSYNKDCYTKINSETWDSWAEAGCEWTIPITRAEYDRARESGDFTVYLTPCVKVPLEWFGKLAGAKLLGLASGGAQQIPLFSAVGADCTIFDNSNEQLRRERVAADEFGYDVEIIKGDMTKPLPFDDNSFDIIFHPVSNCYIKDVRHVWNECYRILKPGGRLLAGFDNGMNFLFDDIENEPLVLRHKLPFDPLAMSDEEFAKMRDNFEGIQFSHSLEEQIGGQLEAGFTLRALYEDRDREGCGILREYTAQYMATLAVKPV